MILALLKKDFRVIRLNLISAGILTFTIYAAMFGFVLVSNGGIPPVVLVVFFGPATIAIYLTAFLAACMGATAFATERSDRSADFLAMLPVTRRQIIASKLLASTLSLLAFWMIDVFFLESSARTQHVIDPQVGMSEFITSVLLTAAGLCVMMFGAGWMFSAFLSSATICFALSIVFGLIMYFVIFFAGFNVLFRLGPDHLIFFWSTIAGLAAFFVGKGIYLRRVEP